MPAPLTAERFEEFVELFTTKHSDTIEHLEKIDGRLDAIERILWEGRRLDDLTERLATLATRTGNPDLAQPTISPTLAAPR